MSTVLAGPLRVLLTSRESSSMIGENWSLNNKERVMGVVVMGVGICGSFPASGGLSYRELIAKAATMAYEDAGVTAEQIDGAVSCEEDFNSGYSIADEYVPDQLGMVRKPVYTIGGDFLQGIASAVMQINTGRFNILVVESYSKASNIMTKDEILAEVKSRELWACPRNCERSDMGVASGIGQEINRRGEDSRFTKLEDGRYQYAG